MLKKMLMTGISILMVVALGACGKSDVPAERDTDSRLENEAGPASETPNDENSAHNSEKTNGNSESNVLIAYFSWSGNTKQLADMIQGQIGGELFEIKPETPYTNDINELSGISLQEQKDNIRPELNSVVEDMDQYDLIFIGFPNWWNNMPMPVFTFLEEYDFSEKTVIPFTTYGNGGWGKSISSMQDTLPDATILDGLAVQEHELAEAPTVVAEWMQELGLTQ